MLSVSFWLFFVVGGFKDGRHRLACFFLKDTNSIISGGSYKVPKEFKGWRSLTVHHSPPEKVCVCAHYVF